MLHSATATINLEDLDKLRAASRELNEIKNKIAACSEIIFSSNESDPIIVSVKPEKIKKLAADYSTYQKPDYEWVDTDDVEVIFEEG